MIEARAPLHVTTQDQRPGISLNDSGFSAGFPDAPHITLAELADRAKSALSGELANTLVAGAMMKDPNGTPWLSAHKLTNTETITQGTVMLPTKDGSEIPLANYTYAPATLPQDAAQRVAELSQKIETAKKHIAINAVKGRRHRESEKILEVSEPALQELIAGAISIEFSSEPHPATDQQPTKPIQEIPLASGLIASVGIFSAIAARDSARRTPPKHSVMNAARAGLAALVLSACGGAAQPGLTPKIEYAPTSTAAPTATRIEPTATIFASPTPLATVRPPEIRPSVTPDPNTLSKITFTQLETMPSAAPLIGALRALSDTRLIGANFDAAGRPTFAGVDLSIASQIDAQGKVKAEGSFPYFTVKDGPDTGVVQRGAFYAPAFDATQNPDGSLTFKFYENEKPVLLLPTTLQKILGVTDPIRVMPDLKNGRLSVVRLSADGKPANVVAWTSLLNFDHLTPDEMVWDRPDGSVPPIKPSTGITLTTGVTRTLDLTNTTGTETNQENGVKINQLTESSFTIEGHPLVSKVKIGTLNINGTEFAPKAEVEFARQLADFATNAVLLNHVLDKHEGALPKTEAQLTTYIAEMEAARTSLTAQGSLAVAEARPRKNDPNSASSIIRHGTTVKPGMGVSLVDMARKDIGLPQDMFPIVTDGGSSKYSKFLVGIDSKTNTLIIGMNSEGMQDLPAQAPALGTTAGMLLVDIATQDVRNGLIWMALGSRLSNEKLGSVNAADYGVSGYGKLIYNFPSNNRKGNVSDAFTRFLVEKVAGKTALQQNASDQPVFDFVAKK